MDMKKLFEDFKKHVEQLDDDAIKQSISRAIEHSINSMYISILHQCLYMVIELMNGSS